MSVADATTVLSLLDIVGASRLMECTAGSPEVVIGLLDGPVNTGHADLCVENIHYLTPPPPAPSKRAAGAARAHGTYVAGILSARRGSAAPAICPGCTLLVRPVFLETAASVTELPRTTSGQLADAIMACVDAGAHVLNLSVAVDRPSSKSEQELELALDYAMGRGAVVVAAAGNQGILGSSVITRHPWVIPVTACDSRGWPLAISNLGSSIGRRGLMAPGEGVKSLGVDGRSVTSGGTSVAAPFVTGVIALLLSVFRDGTATEVRSAVSAVDRRRASVVPPLLDAWSAYQLMQSGRARG
jgi:subtilisin family serine protease